MEFLVSVLVTSCVLPTCLLRCCVSLAWLQLVYCAFDILYVGSESIITWPLHDRHMKLRDAISCIAADKPGVACNSSNICGRIVALLPDQPVPLPVASAAAAAVAAGGGGSAVSCAAVPELVLSRTGSSLADVQRMYDVAISRQVRICSKTILQNSLLGLATWFAQFLTRMLC